MVDLSTVLLGCALILIVAAWFRYGRRSLLDKLPGPKGLPLLGNILQIDASRPHFTMTDWARLHGPIYRLRLGIGRDMVVVSGAETIRQALSDRLLAGRPKPFRAGCVSNGFRGIGFGDPLCPAWKMLRKSVRREVKATDAPGLRRLQMVTTEVLEDMRAEITAEGSNGTKAIDVRPYLYAATLNVVCAFLVGARYGKTDEEFQLFQKMERLGVTLVTSAGGSGAEVDAFPWLRYFGHPICARMQQYKELLNDLYARMKERASCHVVDTSAITAGENPLIWTLSNDVRNREEKSRDNTQELGFTEEHVKGTFADLILGGTASTTNLVYSLLNTLLHHKDVYDRLKSELAEVCANNRGPPALADRPSMIYTQATILELLRYVAIAPFTVPHKALEDTVVDGYQIPKGTEVIANLWSLHHDEEYWTEPWRFDPDRFLDPNDKSSLLPSSHPRRRCLMPFGAGPRRCIGETFATSRLFLLITGLLSHFDLLPAETETETKQLVSCDPRTYDLGIAIYPKEYSLRMIPSKMWS